MLWLNFYSIYKSNGNRVGLFVFLDFFFMVIYYLVNKKNSLIKIGII